MKFAVDMDGTITNESPKQTMRPTIEETVAACYRCTVKRGVEVLREENVRPLIITGRKEILREATEYWLETHDIPNSGVVMCPNHYYDHDFAWEDYYAFKLEAHKTHKVSISLDDNKTLVDILNKNGINARVVDGDFRATFNMVKDSIKKLRG